MAAAHMPPPCALRSTWSLNHTTCSSSGVGAGGEAKRGSNVGFSLKKLSCSSKKFRPYLSCKEAGRWRRTGICSARFDFRGNSAEQAKEEDASILSEMSTLVDELAKLNEVVNEANKGIGADVRNRVDVLYNRATLLKYSADRMVDSGGRVPVQLTATLKGLQREHASVENIVRLAMEAGPVIPDTEDPPSTLNPFPREAEPVVIDNKSQALKAVLPLIEKEERKASVFESLTRQSSLEEVVQPTTSKTGDYVMSTPAAKDSSPLAAFRKEIERRVMEQLSGKKTPTTEPDVTSKEQEGLVKGDAVSEDNKVLGLLQNLPLKGRLPRRPRERGAVKDEAQAADTYTGEVDAPEAQPQILEKTQDSVSLANEQQQGSVVETESNSKELEKLRSDLSVLEQQLADAKEGSARADKAEAQLQQLTKKLTTTVPLEVHDQVVKLERESLSMARTKIAQVTTELKEKESMLSAIKKDMMAEQDNLLDKVKELSGELSKRISAEEVEAAVNNAVHELEKELGNALKRAEALKVELETNEKLLKQLQKEWDVERTSLRGELASVKGHLTDLQMEQASDRAQLKEALERVSGLEDSVIRLEQAMIEAEEERIIREKNVLATVRSLVADMVKTKRAQAKSGTLESELLEATNSIDGNDKSSAEDVLATMFSGEKAVALETFFVMMGVLIQQENERLETSQSTEGGNGAGFRESKEDHYLSKVRSSRVDSKRPTKPIITLYYESSWEYAYLHYSADGSEWTPLPGACMRNGIVVNNMPLKVIDVEGSKLEFVLTDGRGSWDCAPSGGNYHIKNSGTFLLSSGFIEQKR
ncbi:hypothetical protein M758_1G111800 [Ceratodon purpureus]|nr:hypothetical protein M758_1G111800 [Ceratodon purpureus]